ncbi:MAG TPA: DUF1343 domain-containing protein [Spirochaetota bacterium]|nr:DUF1343 domain-containing protein [Spirochaetota bacterium]
MRKTARWIVFAVAVSVLFDCASPAVYNLPARRQKRVYSGLENFIAGGAEEYRGKKIALVTNHSGVDFNLRKNIDLLRRQGLEIVLACAPEHGLYGYENDYDSMLYQADSRLNVIVYNLHHLSIGQLRHLFGPVEAVIFDIQDMGMRCYTYVSSLKQVMDALNGTPIGLVVLDRPNPLGFLGIDGAYLHEGFQSRHISAFPSTFIYNMTMGEAARFYRAGYARDVRLKVVPLKNYRRDLMYNETMLPWVPPSPNLPTYESSVVYSAIVMLEGVNLSVGRGTTKPFEYIGAPWIDPRELARRLSDLNLPNFRFRPVYFSPTFSKYAGMRCGGVQIFYMGGAFSPMEVSYRIITFLKNAYPEFHWDRHRDRYHVDFLAGTDAFRRYIDEGRPFAEFAGQIAVGQKEFNRQRKKHLMY